MTIYSTGDLIANRYEVVKTLAGGMGIVYLCLDRQKDFPVALKTFKPEYLPNRAARDRFLREGTIWVELGRHPHIVRAHSVEHIGDGREVYLVLEWVAEADGKRDASLRAWLMPGRPLPVEQTLLFALHIARGMKHATAKIPGLVHRDLKPENILVGHEGNVRVTDFGLAKTLAELDTVWVAEAPPGSARTGETPEVSPRRTQLTGGGVAGTPLYMAPEQWTPGASLDARADIYAFGCILYEMTTGQIAATGKNKHELAQAHRSGQVGKLTHELPGEISKLVQRCLPVNREHRYANWNEVESAVTRVYRQVTGQDAPIQATAEEETRTERVAVGWSYSRIGHSYLDMGKTEVALGYFERAREVGQAEDEPFLEANGLNYLGGAYNALGNVRRAVECYEQALAILREDAGQHGEGAIWSGEGTILGNLGYAYRRLGKTRRAIECFEQLLVISREIEEHYGESVALSGLGLTYAELGDLRRAIGLYEQSLAIDREIGHRVGEGADLSNLGEAYLNLGDEQRAIGYLEQALAIAREIGDRNSEGNALGGLGNAHFRLGKERQAIGYFEQALAILREIGDRRGEGATLGNLGNAYANLGDGQRAIAYYEQATVILEEIGDVMSAANIHFNMAVALSRQKRFAEALPHAEKAAWGFARVGHTQNAQQAQRWADRIRTMLPELEEGANSV